LVIATFTQTARSFGSSAIMAGDCVITRDQAKQRVESIREAKDN
jgi:hypothetical protein